MHWKSTAFCCACAALWLPPASAQSQMNQKPADASASASEPAYRSAFEGYRPFQDEKLAPWREVNDEVGRVGGQIGIFGGGHAGHGGGKPVPNTPAPAVAAPQTPSPAHGPGHQGMKK